MENDKKRDYQQKDSNPQEKNLGTYESQMNRNANRNPNQINATDDFEENDYQDYAEDGEMISSSSGPRTYEPESQRKQIQNQDDLNDTDENNHKSDSVAYRTPGL